MIALRAPAKTIMAMPHMLSAGSFAELSKLSLTQVRRMSRNRDLLQLQHSTIGARYPAWQISGNAFLPGIRDLYHVFSNDGWMVYDFLTQPNNDPSLPSALDSLWANNIAPVLIAAHSHRPLSRWRG